MESPHTLCRPQKRMVAGHTAECLAAPFPLWTDYTLVLHPLLHLFGCHATWLHQECLYLTKDEQTMQKSTFKLLPGEEAVHIQHGHSCVVHFCWINLENMPEHTCLTFCIVVLYSGWLWGSGYGAEKNPTSVICIIHLFIYVRRNQFGIHLGIHFNASHASVSWKTIRWQNKLKWEAKVNKWVISEKCREFYFHLPSAIQVVYINNKT